MAINNALTASRGGSAADFDGLVGGALKIALGERSRFGSGGHPFHVLHLFHMSQWASVGFRRWRGPYG